MSVPRTPTAAQTVRRASGYCVLAAALVSVLATSACGSSGHADAAASSKTSLAPYTPGPVVQAAQQSAADASRSAAEAEASASAAAAAAKAAGTTVATSAGSQVTYYSMQRPAAKSAPKPESAGTEWVAADVGVCTGVVPSGAYVSSEAWTLIDANGGVYEPSSTGYSQFPSPEYPFQRGVTSNQCVRGWIVYPVPVGVQIVKVVYQPDTTAAPLANWTA